MRTQVKLHKKATVTLCRRFIPTKTRPLRWQTHSTRHCHKVSASSPHGQFPRHPRSPATCARFSTTTPRKPPRLAQAKRPQNEVAYPHLVAVRRTYLRRERPPFCVCAIRIAQIRRCTHTSLVRPPSVISTGHLSQATPLKINVQSAGNGCCWCALDAGCALLVSATWPRPSTGASPRPSRAHPRHPGRRLGRRAAARRCLESICSSPKQTGGSARTRRARICHRSSRDAQDDSSILKKWNASFNTWGATEIS